jgi:probable phosphoglycerate mutase
MSDTVLTLIRHGQSFANVEPIVESYSCRGLTPLGTSQAEQLAARFRAEQTTFDVLYASTLKRARMTAEIIAPALGLPIIWEDDQHELRVGEVDGMCYADVTKQYPSFDRGIKDYHVRVAPNGESWNEFATRCARVLHTITAAHPGARIAVVCHGGVIESSFLWALNLNAGARHGVSFPAHNTAMTVWKQHISPYDGRLEWQLSSHNDHTHLRTL